MHTLFFLFDSLHLPELIQFISQHHHRFESHNTIPKEQNQYCANWNRNKENIILQPKLKVKTQQSIGS